MVAASMQCVNGHI
jgi:hypothetical protein